MRGILHFASCGLLLAACGGTQQASGDTIDERVCEFSGRVVVELDAISTEVVLTRSDRTHAWLGLTTTEGVQVMRLRLDHLGQHDLDRIGAVHTVAEPEWRVAALDEDEGSVLIGLRTRHGNLGRVRAVLMGAVGDLGVGASIEAPPDARIELDVGFRDGVPVAMLGTNGATQATLLVSTAASQLELPGALLGAPEWKPENDVFEATIVEHGVERWIRIKPDGSIERVNVRLGIGQLLDCGGDGWTPVDSLPEPHHGLLACTRTEGGVVRIRVVESSCSIHTHELI